jgi:4-aminobutyrate aminotransferase-like enzyme
MIAPVHGRVAPDLVTALPGPRSRALLDAQREVFYPGLTAGLFPFVAARKAGWTIEDVDGNLIADLASASASVPLGAGRADLAEAAAAAIARYGNEDSHAVASEPMLPLARRLLEITPASLTRVDLSLNGTESVETAIRLMRRATGRPIVLAFHGGYHGETTTTATVGAEHHEVSRGLRALSGGFVHVPHPHPYRSPFGAPRPGGTGDATVDYIADHVLFHLVDPSEVAGVLIEPIVGAGGVLEPPAAFWPALVALCREHDWLLCADEVKTGFGRTGTMFAVERWGVQPDLMCLGKGMGGGVMPIGAVLGSERAMGSFDDVSTGSTWSWLPAACAASLAAIDVIEREGVLENVRALEAIAVRALGALPERHPQVGQVRVVGCFIAIELVADPETRERAPALQAAVAAECLRRGVIGDSSSASFNLQPSLAMAPEDLERVLGIVVAAIDTALCAEAGR